MGVVLLRELAALAEVDEETEEIEETPSTFVVVWVTFISLFNSEFKKEWKFIRVSKFRIDTTPPLCPLLLPLLVFLW